MRYLIRLDKPQKLKDNEVKWTQKFIESGKDRPNNSQYAHQDIKEALCNISYHKCFYSEIKFTHYSEMQVDHYIEVAEDKTKAFEWENLYLSQKESNVGKPTNLTLPNRDCLDPFLDIDRVIEENLGFEDEQILALTEKGRNTIQKYQLDKPIYNMLRMKELKKFDKIARAIAFSGKALDDELKRKLINFANPDKPFSLMFKKVLSENGLI